MIIILKNGKRIKKFTSSAKNCIKYIEKIANKSIKSVDFKKSLDNDVFYVGNDCYTICY